MFEKEVKARESILKHLIANGYPPESLATEWRSGKHGLVYDIAIIDPKTTELISLIELKVQSELMSSSTAIREIRESFLRINKKNVQFFFVSVKNDSLHFSQFIPNLINFEKGEFIPLEGIPNFENLLIKSRGENRKDAQEKIEIICWISAVVIGIILFLNFTHYIEITYVQLTLLGAIIALILIPFASKIKIFNIEFERREKNK
jgi:hypothetical protein